MFRVGESAEVVQSSANRVAVRLLPELRQAPDLFWVVGIRGRSWLEIMAGTAVGKAQVEADSDSVSGVLLKWRHTMNPFLTFLCKSRFFFFKCILPKRKELGNNTLLAINFIFHNNREIASHIMFYFISFSLFKAKNDSTIKQVENIVLKTLMLEIFWKHLIN